MCPTLMEHHTLAPSFRAVPYPYYLLPLCFGYTHGGRALRYLPTFARWVRVTCYYVGLKRRKFLSVGGPCAPYSQSYLNEFPLLEFSRYYPLSSSSGVVILAKSYKLSSYIGLSILAKWLYRVSYIV